MLISMNHRRKRTTDYLVEASIEHTMTKYLLTALLKKLSVAFSVNQAYRRNIVDFNAKYLFRTRDNLINITAVFGESKLTVHDEALADPHIAVTFRDAKTMRAYLSSLKPDILDSILKQDVTIEGNLNYLYKLTYMVRHLQLKVLKQI
jgi:hypothetical protein